MVVSITLVSFRSCNLTLLVALMACCEFWFSSPGFLGSGALEVPPEISLGHSYLAGAAQDLHLSVELPDLPSVGSALCSTTRVHCHSTSPLITAPFAFYIYISLFGGNVYLM